MTAVLVIFLLSCGGLLLLVFCKPAVSVRGRRVSIFWTAPLAGALCMILTGQISPGEVAEGLTGAGGQSAQDTGAVLLHDHDVGVS